VTRAALQRHTQSAGPVVAAVAVLALCPFFVSAFFLSALLTHAIWLGLTALSLIFLAGYGGMVSLAQVGLFGVAGFTYANLVLADGGLASAWNPWPAALAGIAVATALGLLFGAISARSEGIYFLMITLALGVLIFFFFAKATQLSGFGGVNAVDRPAIVSSPRTDPNNIFWISLGTAVVLHLLVKYVVRTPFGYTLQGIRDDPGRMRALGYNVELHRILAFGFAASIAAVAGILFVWWSTRIDPGSVNIGAILGVLVVALIGGLFRLEGAWIGALAFVLLDNYSRDLDFVGPQFNTLIGLVFLLIVLLSPGGLLGIWEQVTAGGRRALGGQRPELDEPAPPARRAGP
jgi:branched-chain amino acid transport system permease protein